MVHPHPDQPLEEVCFDLGMQLGAASLVSDARAALDRLAEHVTIDDDGPEAHAAALIAAVYETGGFRGNREDYYDPRNSILSDVINSRRGIPITLAIVLIAVGRRVGIAVDGIGFPGHFLARIGGKTGQLIDPFNEGRILTKPEVDALATRFLGDTSLLTDAHLAAATDADILTRMLVNLQHAYRKRGRFARAMLVSDKLVDLTGNPEHIRDRGLLAIALGSNEIAEGDLIAYLAARPTARDVPTIRVALEQLQQSSKNVLQ